MRFLVLLVILSILPVACSDSGLNVDNDLVEMTASVNPEGAGSVNPPSGTYEVGKAIKIEAVDANPADSLQFLSWSGDTTATENPLRFSIQRDMDLTANFGKPDFSLITSVTPEGAGTVDPSSGKYQIGTEVEVMASGVDGYQFQEWSGDTTSSENPLRFTIQKDMELIAHFDKPIFSFLASVSPQGVGTVEPSEGEFESGSEVEVAASSTNEDYNFSGWSGDITSSDNPLTFTIENNVDLVANFEKTSYSYSASVTPESAGSVNPADGNYKTGSQIQATASANEGYQFTEWQGDISSTANPVSLTINSDTKITAAFEKISQPFANQISVSDGVNPSTTLTFGMDEQATADFDPNLDKDLPPRPPAGAFDARFTIPGYGLSKDYRAVREQATQWTLQTQSAKENTVTFSWDFSNSSHLGSLVLTDDLENPTVEIDMESRTSYEVSGQTETVLYIISER